MKHQVINIEGKKINDIEISDKVFSIVSSRISNSSGLNSEVPSMVIVPVVE